LFLDADDIIRPEAIARMVAKANGSDNVLVLTDYILFSNSPDDPMTTSDVQRFDNLLPALIHENLGPTHAFLCPRVAVDKVGGFDESLRSCEDWDLWLRLAATGIGFATVPELGACYRMTPGSMSSNSTRMLETRAQVLLRAIRVFTDTPVFLAKWGGELAIAAKRVRRRLRAQVVRPDLIRKLTDELDFLAARGFRPPVAGKEAVLERVLGRDWADRFALAYFRRFDRETFNTYGTGYC
jgi:hypothetical protein